MGKIQAVKAGLNLFRTMTVSASSKRLFSFAQKHKLKASGGGLSEDGLILTHLSHHPPRNDFIDTVRTGAGMSRDSVHFAVNHGVQSHLAGNWSSCEYAVLMPMSAARQTAGNKFAGGVAADFFSKGKVKIPKGSVIVRRSVRVPEGKYRISDASKIEEFRQLHGVKIIETSSPDMVSTVDNIVHRLGYKVKSGDATSWGGSLSDFNLFNSYLRANGMKPMMHTFTPNGKTEMLIEHLHARSKKLADWTIMDKKGEVVLDYKKEYLEALKYIENFAKRTGFPKDFDTKQLAEIIRSSATPQEAIKLIESRLKFKPMDYALAEAPELDLLRSFRLLVGGSKYSETADNLVINYLQKANKTSLRRMNNAPQLVETIPDAVMQENPALKEAVMNLCKQNGLKHDNTLANKLYELG